MDDWKGYRRISLEIVLTENQKEILVKHAQSNFPNESCALLFGTDDSKTCTVKDVFLVENVEKSPINFTISNEELLKGYKEAERKKLDVIGIFHSHPHSEAVPSLTDKEFMVGNPVVWVIFSNKHNDFKAYILESSMVQVSVKIV
ncbi:MAG: M67 family metallopeptidase [Thaumarchaeota archaeon]|nr:M67 family metallopeptidase [Nitrososphaerota archaeon]